MIAVSATAPFLSLVSMLPKLATESAGPWPFRTTCGDATRHAPCADVVARRARRTRAHPARRCRRLAARILVEGPVPRRRHANARRPQPRRDAGDRRHDHLQARVDEDDPAADLVHERPETETNA